MLSLDDLFTLIATTSYWVIVVLWLAILSIFLGKLKRTHAHDEAFRVLILVLAIDAFRTVFENLYFGIYFNALFGVIPASLQQLLGDPALLMLPKLANVAAGVLVFALLARRWLPSAEREREAMVRTLHESQDEAARLKDRYRHLVDASPDLICSLDRQGRLVDVGARSQPMLGYAPAELVGRALASLLEGEDAAWLQHLLDDVLESETAREATCRLVRQDGAPVRITWSISWSATDQLFIVVGRDTTRQFALEMQANRSLRLESVGQLTGGVAHDFNNLLTVILGNADLLREELQSQPALAPLAQMIGGAAQRGAELTQRLLAFAGRQALEPESVDANRLVAGMDGLLRRTLGEHVEIETVPGVGLWPALVDPAQLESALLNLCLNARDAMPEGGRLTILTANAPLDREYADQHPGAEPGDYVQLAVSDTGSGISPEHLGRVFEPFYTTKETGKGTGLGLSMVYGFVKQSRGYVTLHSELGRGTTVTMYLPRADVAAAPVETRSAAPAEGGSATILLVEDDELVRHYASSQLAALGYRVIEATNGAAAMEIVQTQADIDLLFTDVVMPGGMSGHQLADAARALRPALKVLYTSGYAENVIVHQGRLDAGVHLLQKPYRRADLARQVRDALDASC